MLFTGLSVLSVLPVTARLSHLFLMQTLGCGEKRSISTYERERRKGQGLHGYAAKEVQLAAVGEDDERGGDVTDNAEEDGEG